VARLMARHLARSTSSAWEKADSKFIVFDVFVRANLFADRFPNACALSERRHSFEPGQWFSRVVRHRQRPHRLSRRQTAWSRRAGFKTVNMLASPVKNASQVQLQIRVAEVSKNKLRELGTSYMYQGSPGAGGYVSGGGPGSPKPTQLVEY